MLYVLIRLRQTIVGGIAKILAKSFNLSQVARLVVKFHDNDGNENIQKNGELPLLTHLVKLSDNESVFFDIGANIGGYSSELIRAGVKGKLILIDPLSRNLRVAHDKMKELDFMNFQTLECAVSDSKGMTTFYSNTNSDLSAHDSLHDMQAIGYDTNVTKTEVQVTTLDDILCDLDIEKVHFMKIDVEGNELKVFDGARATLERGAVKFIQFEFGNAAKAARVFLYDLVSLLESNHYKIYVVKPRGLMPLNYSPFTEKKYSMINLLAVHENSLSEVSKITIAR
jgi:FkbM family methyltransferase